MNKTHIQCNSCTVESISSIIGCRSAKEERLKITVYYNNVNGIKSKTTSIQQILNHVQPHILALNETKQASTRNLTTLKGYDIVSRTVKIGQGCLLIAVRSGIFNSVIDVTTTHNKNIMVKT